MSKHEELKRLALAATPGPWEAEDDKVLRPLPNGDGDYFAQCWDDVDVAHDRANAAYLAAVSPSVVLALLDELAILRAGLEGMLAVSADRKAFVMLGPRAFAQAERIGREAIALADKGVSK